MLSTTEIFNRLSKHFNEETAWTIAAAITDAYDGLAEKLTTFEQIATKDEVNELRDAIKQLAKAQSKTEERLNQLAEAQSKTEERLNQLAEAQRRTEKELAKLTIVVGRVQKNFGGLSDSIGFMLEDRALKALPALLKERFEIEVKGRLIRTFLENAQGKREEVNIYGKGLRNGSELVIIGESKSQLSKRHIARFKKKIERLAPVLEEEIFSLMITYMAEPEVMEQTETEKIPVFMSYEF